MPVKKKATRKTAASKAAKQKPRAKKTAARTVKKAAAKKVARKAPKKAASKPAKKAAKKVAKKAAKKPAKKATKKATKKVAKKTVAKKVVRSAARKPAAKKATVKAARKKVAKKAKKPAKTSVEVPARRAGKQASAGSALVESSRGTTGLPANGAKLTGFVAKQRQRLLDLRDELINSMYGVTRETLRNAPEGSEASGSGMHQGDAGSDAYDRDFALSVLAKEQDALFEVEEALKRIQRGAYGVCEISARKIPQARLEAIPFARLTVECQAEWEKEHGQRRFRPTTEIGFGGDYEYETEE